MPTLPRQYPESLANGAADTLLAADYAMGDPTITVTGPLPANLDVNGGRFSIEIRDPSTGANAEWLLVDPGTAPHFVWNVQAYGYRNSTPHNHATNSEVRIGPILSPDLTEVVNDRDIGPARVQIGTDWGLIGVVTPSQITSNQDNYAPTGIAAASVLRLSTDASRNLTGILAPSPDYARRLIVENIGSFDLVLKNDVTSTAANRFKLTADTPLPANTHVELIRDVTLARWVMLGGVGGSSGSATFAGLTDVALSSPVTGDVPIYNTITGKWTNGPQTGGGGGGGGGMAHSYVGYNTVGASREFADTRTYFKKITVAADGLIASIGANLVEADGDPACGLSVGLYEDNAGAPGKLIGVNAQPSPSGTQNPSFTLADQNPPPYGAARWLHVPLGIWVAAGDYWIAAQTVSSQVGTGHGPQIAYDGSGSDRYQVDSGGSMIWSDYGRYNPTTTAHKYSIRADFMTDSGGGGGGGGTGTMDVIVLQDQKTHGTTGGTFTSGALRTRDLNTIVADPGGHCALSGNQFTIQPGTYSYLIEAPAYYVLRNRACLYDVTNAAIVGEGSPAMAYNGGAGSTSLSVVSGHLVITVPTTYEVRHEAETTNADGFGIPTNFGGGGEYEVYTQVQLLKLDGVGGGGGGGGSAGVEGTYAARLLTLSGLAHHWAFTEASGNFVDGVGGLTLVKSGTVTYALAGAHLAGAVRFGTGAVGQSSGLGAIPVGAGARTFLVVFRPSASTFSKQCLLSYGVTGSNREWFSLFLNDGANDTPSIAVWADDLLVGDLPCNADAWHLLIASYDGDQTITLSLDGQLFGRTLLGTLATPSSGDLHVGQTTAGANQFLGDWDDLAVLTRFMEPWEQEQTTRSFEVALAGGSGGGSGGSETIYRAVATADHLDNPSPTTYTLVDALTLTTAASPTAMTALVAADAHFVADHPNRFGIFLDGTQSYPASGSGLASTDNDAGTGGHISILAALSIPGDSATHVIELRYDAQASTDGTTFKHRSLVARVFPSTPDPYVVGGGGGGGGGALPSFLTFVAPPTTGWTWDNQGGGTLDSTAESQYLELPNTSGLNLRVRYRTAPATPYTITAALLADLSGAPGSGDEAFTALGFRDSSGKLIHWGYGYASGNPYITLGKWTSATSYSADYLLSGPKSSAGIYVARSPNWLRIQDNGTNLIFSYSIDAVHWIVFDTRARTDWFASGPTQIAFGACPRGSDVRISLVSYQES